MITLDGVKPEELGFMVVRGTDAPILPKTRNANTKVLPGRHGQIRYGKTYLDGLEFQLPCKVLHQDDYIQLQMAANKIAEFFTDEYGNPRKIKLIFNYEPDKYYIVQYEGFIPLKRLVTYGKFVLPLTSDNAHKQSIVKSTDKITWGSRIPFTTRIPFGYKPSQYTVTSSQSLDINNNGTLVIRPVVQINGTASALALTINGESFYFGDLSNGTLLIDAQQYTVIKNGKNYLFDMQGGDLEKLELFPGNNNMVIDGGNLNLTISFKFEGKYR